MTMDARKQRVLQAIVALYGLEGEPVGSSVAANLNEWAGTTRSSWSAVVTSVAGYFVPGFRLCNGE